MTARPQIRASAASAGVARENILASASVVSQACLRLTASVLPRQRTRRLPMTREQAARVLGVTAQFLGHLPGQHGARGRSAPARARC